MGAYRSTKKLSSSNMKRKSFLNGDFLYRKKIFHKYQFCIRSLKTLLYTINIIIYIIICIGKTHKETESTN